MKRGSILIDLAVEQGGNCELSQADKIVETEGVRIVGWRNMMGRLAQDASALYARNLYHFVQLLVEDGQIAIDWDDEIIAKTALVKQGEIVRGGQG